ncbi:hypothetical protein K8I28_11235, partial [bacterium]|nr:hypothetical protein [bacterium]
RVDTQIEIISFDWTSTGGNMLVPGDEVTFELEMADDTFGAETGGQAVVMVHGWDDIALTDQGDGRYTGSYTLTDLTPKVNDASVSVAFTDRAENIATNESDLRLTAHWVNVGERFNPVAQTGSPYAVVISSATIHNVEVDLNVEVGFFDNNAFGENICVGSTVFDGYFPFPMTVWEGDEANGLPGYEAGNPMIIRLWDASEQVLYEADFEIVDGHGNGTYGFGPYAELNVFVGEPGE